MDELVNGITYSIPVDKYANYIDVGIGRLVEELRGLGLSQDHIDKAIEITNDNVNLMKYGDRVRTKRKSVSITKLNFIGRTFIVHAGCKVGCKGCRARAANASRVARNMAGHNGDSIDIRWDKIAYLYGGGRLLSKRAAGSRVFLNPETEFFYDGFKKDCMFLASTICLLKIANESSEYRPFVQSSRHENSIRFMENYANVGLYLAIRDNAIFTTKEWYDRWATFNRRGMTFLPDPGPSGLEQYIRGCEQIIASKKMSTKHNEPTKETYAACARVGIRPLRYVSCDSIENLLSEDKRMSTINQLYKPETKRDAVLAVLAGNHPANVVESISELKERNTSHTVINVWVRKFLDYGIKGIMGEIDHPETPGARSKMKANLTEKYVNPAARAYQNIQNGLDPLHRKKRQIAARRSEAETEASV